MNTNTKYVYYIRHKQAYVNRWMGKQVKKNPTGNLKNHLKITSSYAIKGP